MKAASAVILLFFLGCASKKHGEKCIDSKLQATVLSKIIPALDRMESETITELKLVNDACWKRTFTKNGRTLILYSNPASGSVSVASTNSSGTTEERRVCLERAITESSSWPGDLAENIIEQNLKLYPKFFNDPDVGAVKWLKCGAPLTTWTDSVATLLHELNHENKNRKGCLFNPISKQYLCFPRSKEAPLRGTAGFEKIPVSEAKVAESLMHVQKIYLTDIDQPYHMLLDELLSYTITLNSFRNLLVASPKNIYEKDGKRFGVLLPLFQTYVVRYLDNFHKADSKKFNELIVKESSSSKSI